MPATGVTPETGVLLVGHGTRDRRGTDEFFELGDRLANQMAGRAVVRPALLEFQPPTIATAWGSLVERGVQRIVVAPLLLFAAGHAKSDIPGEVESARAATPNGGSIEVTYSRPISRQGFMVAAVRERLSQALQADAGLPGQPAMANEVSTAIVMVGRGSRDVCASADMRVLSEVAVRGKAEPSGTSLADEHKLSPIGLATTFYAMATPRLPDTLDQVAGTGLYRRVIVQPHLLFNGRLYEAIVNQVAEARQRFPEVEFIISDYLGPTDAVAQAIASRIQQATLTRPE